MYNNFTVLQVYMGKIKNADAFILALRICNTIDRAACITVTTYHRGQWAGENVNPGIYIVQIGNNPEKWQKVMKR